jgi:hydroxyacylglutathione hydrolase
MAPVLSADGQWVPSGVQPSATKRKYNAALQIKDKDEFIKSLTEDMPPAPTTLAGATISTAKGLSLFQSYPA